MSSVLSSLPTPSQPLPERVVVAPIAQVSTAKEVPLYLRRKQFVPRKAADFGDGGAFPEIHVAQYPLEMGRPGASQGGRTLAVTVGADGGASYDAVVKHPDGKHSNAIVHTGHYAVVPKVERMGKQALMRPDQDAVDETTAMTAAALNLMVNNKVAITNPSTLPSQPGGPQYIKYTPSQQGAAHASGAGQRIIKMQNLPVDPLEPPKFRHTKVPRGPGSPPVPVMHSPPRPVTVGDQANWKIPPAISNWKNPKGYTIPLDKRLAADGRGLQQTVINDKFASLSEALFTAEAKAREAITLRAQMQKELLHKEKSKKEGELRELAMKARMEKGGALGMAARMDTSEPGAFGGEAGAYPPPPPLPGGGGGRGGGGDRGGGRRADSDMDDDSPGRGGARGEREAPRDDETREERESRRKRDEIREERRRERERERRLEAKDAHGTKKSKLTRDRDRDIGEKVALGMAKVGGGEVMYDQRLFNQDQGMNTGFGADDSYGVYDKALFTDRTAAGALYRPKPQDDDAGGDDGAKGTERFKPDKGFKGADVSAGPRSAPVQFERNEQRAPPAAEEADPFGLDQFLSEVKADKGRGKNTLEKIGDGRGGMKAAGGGGSSYDDLAQGGSGRRMEFAKEKGGR
ncbi:hypothetical protein FOA52_006995 [Chlamydomonas sp. UWO 241]|nr:hypothetical protein FOA52_006995 [Chlamydomonas sp. UWO 241]